MVPGSASGRDGQTITGLETDDLGKFSFLPFAGWNTGEYKLNVKVNLWIESTNQYVSTERQISLTVVKAVPAYDIGSQINNIIDLYKKQVPEGPIRKDPPALWPESMYGTYHNVFLAGTKADPNSSFVCGGYQGQVLEFFDKLRFNSNPGTRSLLKGLDYGPVARGALILGGHHSVVLYPIGSDWKGTSEEVTGRSVIFDPWPKQRPDTTTVTSFTGGWGFPRDDGYFQANPDQIFTGYPLTGGVIYVNWSLLEKKRPQAPAPVNSVAVRCPVNVLITDSQGRQVGTIWDSSLVQQFPADVYQFFGDNGEQTGWYFGLPEGKYQTSIVGQSDGTFKLYTSGHVAGSKTNYYGEQPIKKNEQASVYLDPAEPHNRLILQNGTFIAPTNSTKEEDNSDLSTGIIIGIIIAAVVAAVILIILLRFLPKGLLVLLFFLILIGVFIGGLYVTGHNFNDLQNKIETWT